MPFVESSITIKETPEKVYELTKKMEDFPDYMPDVKEVSLIEKCENYTVTNWVTEVEGTAITWKEKEIFDDVNFIIDYKLLEGDLEKFEGKWTFEPFEDGTRVTLNVDYDFGVPAIEEVMGPTLKKKLEENCIMMLSSIKKKIES